MTKRKEAGAEEKNYLAINGEPDFYVRVPRIVYMYARDPYDLAFYIVVKDIAGESGECYVTTPDIAALCSMSTGKAISAREYWIKLGFIIGELKQDAGFASVWHLAIADIWERNRHWANGHRSIDSRIQFKTNGSEKGMSLDRECRRCHTSFTATGRRSVRCSSCQEEAEEEQDAIHKLIKMPQKNFIDKDADQCETCGTSNNLELHLIRGENRLLVYCGRHHDELHERVHAMNPAENGLEGSCGEPALSPHEPALSPHEPALSPHEPKNNNKNNKKKNHKKADSPKKIWGEVLPEILKRVRREDGAMYFSGIEPISIDEGILVLSVTNSLVCEWLNNNKPALMAGVESVYSDLSIEFRQFSL